MWRCQHEVLANVVGNAAIENGSCNIHTVWGRTSKTEIITKPAMEEHRNNTYYAISKHRCRTAGG